jgi:hypothetical protein
MAQLVQRIGYGPRIRHVRDEPYFAWRYQDSLSAYRFLFRRNGGLQGYLVLQTSLYRAPNRVNIVDCEATSDAVRADLLDAAIGLGRFDRLNIWSATLSDPQRAMLHDRNFIRADTGSDILRQRPTVLIRPVRKQANETDWQIGDRSLLDLANWDLRMIDSDGY